MNGSNENKALPNPNINTSEIGEPIPKRRKTKSDFKVDLWQKLLEEFGEFSTTVTILKALDLTDCAPSKLIAAGLDVEEAWRANEIINMYSNGPSAVKVFNDPVHGHIELPYVLMKLVDTPQFQRLRDIRQLGASYHVFPGASHHRFEHCLGVSHLAGKLLGQLRRLQPELEISDVDMICVQMAGLLHDLGHGPFSHLFDGRVIPVVAPEEKFEHEEASVAMIRYLLDSNNLRPELEEHGITSDDISFVEELILGHPGKAYEKRGKIKRFMYEIVANKSSGIDVDKWDYFARDCHHLGIKNNFDHDRFIKFTRVIMVDGELRLCYRDKEAVNLYDMFYTRKTLHRRAYQHSVVTAVDLMITDALIKANDHIRIRGTGGALRRMSECIRDMEAFTKLTDRVYYDILWSTSAELQPARAILQRLETRQLYKFLCQTQRKATTQDSYKRPQLCVWEKEIAERASKQRVDLKDPLPVSTDLIALAPMMLDFGMKAGNPVDNVKFYSKDSPNTATSIPRKQVSPLLPSRFQEVHIRLYYKGESQHSSDDDRDDSVIRRQIQLAFVSWCEDNDFDKPQLSAQLLKPESSPMSPYSIPSPPQA